MIDPLPPDESERRFRVAFDRAAVGMCFVAIDGRFLDVNARLCAILGYSSDELLGSTCMALTHPDDQLREKMMTARMIAGEIPSATWEKRYVTRDGTPIWCSLALALVDDAPSQVRRFVGVIEDIAERKRGEQKLAQSESLLRIAGESARLGGWALDFSNGPTVDDARLSWSDEVYAIHEVPVDTVLSPQDALAFLDADSRERIVAAIDACVRFGSPYDLEIQIVTALGRPRWVRSLGHLEATSGRLVGAYQDVTDRKQAELELVRMNRALTILSGCNEILVRASEEGQLLADICELIVTSGGYLTAWVGYSRDDARRSVVPVASAGRGEAYLARASLSWDANVPEGRGVAGETIRSGRATVITDVSTDERFLPWRVAALAEGFRSVIGLPLRNATGTFGILTLYCAEVGSPPKAELELLQELADDLAFGIEHLRSLVEQRRVHEAVVKISAAVSARSSHEFFERLATNMADAIGAHGAIIARYDPLRPATARTIVAIVDGEPLPAMDLPLPGTPCEELIAHRQVVVTERLRDRYPACGIAHGQHAEAFVGRRLENAAGDPLALMFVFFRQPLEHHEFATSTLKIFAARVAAELEREISDARIVDQASWLDRARDAIVVRGIDGRVTFWNKSAERLYGWSSAEACGQRLADLLFEDASHVREATRDVVADGFWNGEVEHRCRDGSFVRVESRWTTMRDQEGNPRSILSIDTDITQRKAAELEIETLAYYDPLTRLPNRLSFVRRLKAALATCVGYGALLFIDLDNFKAVNDTLGHDTGDLLLQHVAARLRSCVRSSDTVSRFGGDEFVIMSSALATSIEEASAQARRIADDILMSFNTTFALDAYEIGSTPSIGVTIFARDAVAEDLLKEADLAMYEAKATGRNAVRFFDPQMQALASARRALEDDIRGALKRDEFSLVYQPQVDENGRVIGAEALVRWHHEARGAIPPAEFIPVAEDSTLIVPLGRYIMRTACARLVEWSARALTASLKISVNVSAHEFRHPDFVRAVLDALGETGADPRLLVLELTESVLVQDVDTVVAKMTALRGIGVTFSLDDFGTGYSSLAYLKRLPLQQLKIDQSFVADVLVDPNDAVIARTIIALGQSLSLDVIAEGVETAGQRAFLAGHGCRSFQGYYFSRPLAPEAFAEYVAARAFLTDTDSCVARSRSSWPDRAPR
ncbi:MAG: hypothetical protein NVS2B3_00880 [Vulcanimicrobiaceae bacterium]